MDVGFRPVENALEFVPVGHVLERQQLHRRAGNDEAVELAILHLVPGLVEGDEVFLGGVLGLVVANADQGQFDLQRRGADQPGELRLRPDLVGHQVEQADLEGADVLAQGGLLVHDGHALLDQNFTGGELIGDLDRHVANSKKQNRHCCRKAGLRIANGPLATYLTWLQADRPNHHGSMPC